jgi:acetate kinase
MKVLVLNTGSSSIKYELFRMDDWQSLTEGIVERIGERSSERADRGEGVERGDVEPVADHHQGMRRIGQMLTESQALTNAGELFAIGHRVVHGGDEFQKPTMIDATVIEAIRRQIPLAPLHNPANVIGIEAASAAYPGVPQVAVFDTAFHQTMPPHAYRYAVPEFVYREHHVRRYGFHGTSHLYVAKEAAKHLKRSLDSLNLITLHLGNGASVTAIENGQSIDTSMGMTPLEGLIMGTRCGDLDPAVVFYLATALRVTNDELESMLNRESGLKGICGDNDMRLVLQRMADGDSQARLAVEMFAYRVRKYIGAYYALLGSVDAVVFTAGIGENSPRVRAACCEGLAPLGIAIDPQRNGDVCGGNREIREIQSEQVACRVLVIPTDEELEIARQTVEVVTTSHIV